MGYHKRGPLSKRKVLRALLFFIAAAAFCSQISSDEVKITVKKKFARRIPIAVPSFMNAGAENPELSRAIADRLTADLNASGYFAVLKNRKFVDETEADDRKRGCIDFREWTALKADMLARGRYVARQDTLSISCSLYSVASAERAFSHKYHGDCRNSARLVDRMANDIIYALTGEKGLSGSRIAFTSDADGGKQIYILNFPGGETVRVTGGKDISLSPHWTPDGRSLAFTSYVRGRPEIFIMELENRKTRCLASYPGLNAFAAVSPDGRDILLTLSRSGNPELYRMNISTGRLTRLTRTSWVESSPTWSPDGEKIAFVSNRSRSPQIYIMDSRGKTEPKRLTFEGSYNADPDWSPDGEMIAYSSRQREGFRIRAVNLRSGEIISLPATGTDDESPSWAPDSRHLVYSARKNKYLLYVADIYEQIPRQITSAETSCTNPAWSPSP